MGNDCTLYKVLIDGKSCHGGSMEWNLPSGDQPGEWMRYEGKLKICHSGIHLTNRYEQWMTLGCRIYEAEAGGGETVEDDKCVCRSARLLREVDRPKWWIETERFITEEISKVPWFGRTGQLTVPHKRYATRNAARTAIWDAARDAALHNIMRSVCADLSIAEKHRAYAEESWSIWKAGFGCLGKIGNSFIVYDKP